MAQQTLATTVGYGPGKISATNLAIR